MTAHSARHHHHELAAALSAPLSPPPYWLRRTPLTALLESAEPHGIRPLIVERLLAERDCPLEVPARRALVDRAHREDAEDLIACGQLSRTLAALADAGVPCLVFKGAATAHALYARSALRPRDDSDLLIDPIHRASADRTLRALGYQRVQANDRELVMRQALYRAQDRAGVRHNVDLHWYITNRQRQAASFSARRLLLRAMPLPSLGPSALAPAPIDALLIACLHLSAHHAAEPRLIWLYEIRQMLDALTDRELASVAESARANGLSTALADALARVDRVFDTGSRPAVEALAAPTAPPVASRWRHWLDDLVALDGTRQRVRFLAAHAFPSADYLRSQPHARGQALPWLYLRRLVRAWHHLRGV